MGGSRRGRLRRQRTVAADLGDAATAATAAATEAATAAGAAAAAARLPRRCGPSFETSCTRPTWKVLRRTGAGRWEIHLCTEASQAHRYASPSSYNDAGGPDARCESCGCVAR